ncbi:MAG TPA: ABC transporter permease [Polyangia bacterium]|nr:ABC transporter permease [Polyangia bacterium]
MWLEYVKIALTVLRAHKFRAALTMLSITIGAFSIVLMTSLAQSGLATLSRGIEELGGARLIAVFPEKPERARQKRESYTRGLTREDLELASERVPYIRASTIQSEMGEKQVRRSDGRQKVTSLLAGNPGFLDTYNIKIEHGRNLSEDDDAGRRKVCVIGADLKKALFREGEQPLGQMLTLGDTSYRIVGVTRKVNRFGVNFGWDWNDFMLAPDQTLLPERPGEGFAGWMIMRTDDAAHNDMAKRVLNALLESRHRGVDDFRLFDFASVLERWYQIFTIMEVIVGLLAGIALLVGGVGVMNILLVSVRERVHEIGLRKAIGATAGAIRAQFVIEATVMSLLGGLLGALGGAGMAILSGQLIAQFQETWVGVVSRGAVVAALLVSALVGMVFGYVPARRAGRLDPVECLRA